MGLSEQAIEHKMNYDYAYSRQFLQGKRITFNRKSPDDMALFEWVNNQPESGNQYIKRLIREDMERRKNNV